MKLTYKQIEAAREARLWLGQIVLPAVIAGVYIKEQCPELADKIGGKCKQVKNKFVDLKNKVIKR